MKRAALGALVVTALLAGFGCSGGGGGSTSSTLPAAPASNKPATTKAEFHITIPLPQTGANAKRPAYVSPATRSVSFSGSGITPQTIALVASGPGCPIDGSGTTYTCTAAFDAPIADINLQVSTFASTDGTGQALSENTIDQTIIGGQDNNINVTLNGIAATLFLNVTPNTTLTGGTPGSYTATWGAKDASGDIIVGGGVIVDINNVANILAPTLTSSNPTDLTVGTQTGNSWAVAYDGTDLSAAPPTLTLAQSGYTSAVATFTANPTPTATPSPSPTPTATPSPTPSPTPTPIEAISNGNFTTGDLTGWYICYPAHSSYTVPLNPSPAPTGGSTQGAGGTTVASTPRPVPTPGLVLDYNGDAGVQTTTPTSDNGGFAHFAEVGHSNYPYNPRFAVGICQNVTVPTGATLSFSLYEGGNDSFPTSDTEATVFPSGAFSSSVNGAQAATAAAPLFAESNCYNNVGSPAGSTVAWGSSSGSARAKICGDNTVPWPGGKWYTKSFSLSTYATQNVTIFLGQWRSAASGSAGTSTYYNYTYYANVHLTAPGT